MLLWGGWQLVSSSAADLLRLQRWHKHKEQLAEVLSAVKRIPGEAILKVSAASRVLENVYLKTLWLDVFKEASHVFMK